MSRQLLRRLAACALVSLLTTAVAMGQVRDGGAATSPTIAAPTGTGSIAGVVVSGDSASRPMRLATVVLIGATTGVLKVTSTDRDGKFVFGSLPADRYTVGASRPPYLGAVAGARRPARPGSPVVVAAGQKVTDTIIRLPPAAAISGVVVDELGQPCSCLVGVQQRKLQNGVRVLVNVATIGTDERGRYRQSGLGPGEYLVMAHRSGLVPAMTPPRTLASGEFEAALQGSYPQSATATAAPARYAPTFYPGTSRSSDATGVLLAPGDDRTGIDIQVQVVSTSRVEGVVMTADGQPASNASVSLLTVADQTPLPFALGARVGNDGRFLIGNVAPGPYTLTALSGGAPQAAQYATLALDMTGIDALGIQLTLRPPMTLSGRLVFDATTSSPSTAGLIVPFKGIAGGPTGAAQASVGASDASGAFTIKQIMPGRYVFGGAMYFGANTNSVTWTLQSVIADGKDITDRAIDITPESLPKDVVVTLSDKWQSVSGKLAQANGAPANDYTVIVFPADKAYWVTGSRRILAARPDSQGQFILGGQGMVSLPPGDYLLATVTELDRDEQFDPALLASLIPAAVPLSLQPGERKVQDLVIR